MTTRQTVILCLVFSALLVWSGWPSAAAQDQEEEDDYDLEQEEQTDQKEQADDAENYSVEDEDTEEEQAKESGDAGGKEGGEPQEGGKCRGHGSRVPLKSSDCKQFLLCDNGKYVVQDCAPGSVFDKEFGSCNIPRSKDGGCP